MALAVWAFAWRNGYEFNGAIHALVPAAIAAAWLLSRERSASALPFPLNRSAAQAPRAPSTHIARHRDRRLHFYGPERTAATRPSVGVRRSAAEIERHLSKR